MKIIGRFSAATKVIKVNNHNQVVHFSLDNKDTCKPKNSTKEKEILPFVGYSYRFSSADCRLIKKEALVLLIRRIVLFRNDWLCGFLTFNLHPSHIGNRKQ